MEKIKLVDVLIAVAVVVALCVGFFTYKHFRQTAGKQIQDKQKIAFQVFIRGVSLTGPECPVKINDKTFISIRNVPYTDLQIADVKIEPQKTVIASSNPSKPYLIVNDYSKEAMYDILVTLTDEAKITKDGAVVGGNKIKMGLPITLEGIDYKFNGSVSNIRLLVDKNQAKGSQLGAQNNKGNSKIQYQQADKNGAVPTQAQKPAVPQK